MQLFWWSPNVTQFKRIVTSLKCCMKASQQKEKKTKTDHAPEQIYWRLPGLAGDWSLSFQRGKSERYEGLSETKLFSFGEFMIVSNNVKT